MTTRRKKKLFCSFCRKDETTVPSLIAGPGVHICGTCVALCNDILEGRPSPGFAGWDTLGDQDLLESLRPSVDQSEAALGVLHTQVDVLRKRGVSWAAIGDALGISRQAAWERFG